MKNKNELINPKTKAWLQVLLFALVVIALWMMASHAHASDGTEFQAAADKFESWIKGNLGKLAAFVALAVGAIMAAVRKDWSWFMGAVVLSVGMGILIGIVNVSFTATI
jgi:type IV secretory pathway VirB2 component (pilin)